MRTSVTPSAAGLERSKIKVKYSILNTHRCIGGGGRGMCLKMYSRNKVYHSTSCTLCDFFHIIL